MEFKVKPVESSCIGEMSVYSETEWGCEEWGQLIVGMQGRLYFRPTGGAFTPEHLAELSKFVSHLQVFRPWDTDGGAEW
jgi:hypothetical protein